MEKGENEWEERAKSQGEERLKDILLFYAIGISPLAFDVLNPCPFHPS